MSETAYFGFTRIEPGESISKNNQAATTSDIDLLDRLLYALATHDHSVEADAQTVEPPVSRPTLELSAAGGFLPPMTTFHYCVSFVDRNGLETLPSPEEYITTGAPLEPPGAPDVVIETSGGSVTPGLWAYAVTYVTADGGETTPSAIAQVYVQSGFENQVRLELPDLPAEASGYRIYRAKPGQSFLYRCASVIAGPYYDDGTFSDCDITMPQVNTTGRTSSVTITVPGEVVPEGVAAWRLYRTRTPGMYPPNSLVAQISTPTSAEDPAIMPTYIDEGYAALTGSPRLAGAQLPTPPPLTLDKIGGALSRGQVPRGVRSWSTMAIGELVDQATYGKTETIDPITPVRISAHFQTPPILNGGTVTFTLSDGVNSVDLECTDDSGFYVSRLPLTEGGSILASQGSRTDDDALEIVSDAAASEGVAVQLEGEDEGVTFQLGELDAGDYVTSLAMRADGELIDGIRIVVRQVSDETILAEDTFTPAEEEYEATADLAFTAPGGEEVEVLVTYDIDDTVLVLLDKLTYAAQLVTLDAGELTLSVEVVGVDDPGSDVGVTVVY